MGTIGISRNCLLNSKYIIRDYLGLSRLPAVSAILLEDVSQGRNALIRQWILACRLGDDNNCSSKSGTHRSS